MLYETSDLDLFSTIITILISIDSILETAYTNFIFKIINSVRVFSAGEVVQDITVAVRSAIGIGKTVNTSIIVAFHFAAREKIY